MKAMSSTGDHGQLPGGHFFPVTCEGEAQCESGLVLPAVPRSVSSGARLNGGTGRSV